MTGGGRDDSSGRRGGNALSAREAASRIVDRLVEHGHTAYLAGGCVRDRLLGIEPEDYDVATDASPDRIKSVFPGSRGVGEAFGVMLVRVGGHTVEVATFRSEGAYPDGRRPESVRFTTAEEDAERRDFTINGLFEDPRTGALVDFVGGKRDLDDRLLRAIGDPSRRFAEDHLRLLRAVRFAARFGLEIEPETARAIRALAPRLGSIARERIGGEIRRMLGEPARTRAVALLEEFGLDAVVLNEPARRSVGERLARPPESVPVAWALAAWSLDRIGAGLSTDVPTGHVQRWRDALLLSNADTDEMLAVLDVRRRLRPFDALPTHTRKRLAAHPGSAGARWLLAADDASLGERIAAWIGGLGEADVSPEPFVTGDDLILLGLVPGPRFRELLDELYDAQLDGRVTERTSAIELAHRLARQR